MGSELIAQLENLDLDSVDERIMDVFCDAVDTFNKAKYNTVLTPEILKEMLEKDPEWSAMSDEAKDLLGGPTNTNTKAIYDKYSTMYIEF